MSLTPKQRSHLKSLGHHLNPVVMVGKDGVTDGLCRAVSQALTDHELIKVRIGTNSLEDRREVAATLSKQTDCELCQIVGNVLLLYRTHPERPQIRLPA